MASGQDDDRELQSFGFVNTENSNGVQVFFRQRALRFFLYLEDSGLESADGLFESAQPFSTHEFGLLSELL